MKHDDGISLARDKDVALAALVNEELAGLVEAQDRKLAHLLKEAKRAQRRETQTVLLLCCASATITLFFAWAIYQLVK